MTKHTAISYEITKNLHLVRQNISKAAPAKPAEQPTNHLVVLDCSGSMSSDLPQIREQLKRKLPKLLKDGDTLSLVWFSGKGQCGSLCRGEPVATLADLGEINKVIDRWLRPVGLTGFKEPLLEVADLVHHVSKLNKHPFSLFFMSDGCDNQWPRAEILKTVENVAGKLASSTFVEYGYYADRPLLAAMAEKAGGQLIFADAFDKYEPLFEAAMAKHAVGGKRIEVKIDGDPIGGFAWTGEDGEIITYDASAGKAHVPEGTEGVWYLSPTRIGHQDAPLNLIAGTVGLAGKTGAGLGAAYCALSLFAVRMKPDVVYPILKALGDVRFIEYFSVCFGKQKYSEFMNDTKVAAFRPDQRWLKGYDPNKVPADDAFTVLDLLKLLAEDDGARILLDHPAFSYSRISRGRVDADENFSVAESEQLDAIKAEMAGEKKPAKLKELQIKLDALLASKREALVFTANPAPEGYPIANLTYNETRPNISVLVKKEGTVDLRGRLMDTSIEVPSYFKTHIWRNYAIVKDGLVNVEKLPVWVSGETYVKLQQNGVRTATIAGEPTGQRIALVIDLKPLPILNRKMVASVSAKALIELEYELTKARAAQKVYNAYQKELFPDARLASFTELYGEAGTAWLKEQGITPGGFAPKMVQGEARDFYMGKELEVKLKGLSTLPSLKEAKEKMAKGKLNTPTELMAKVITDIEQFFSKNPKNLHEAWLTGQAKAMTAKTRGLIWQRAQIGMGIIVGQVWPTEFKSLDDKTLTVKIDGQDITGTIELSEVKVEI